MMGGKHLMVEEILSKSPDETVALGRTLGRHLQGGELIALVGDLGTGKTHLIKGIALGLEVADADGVGSPTFTIINEYEGRRMLYHVDAYRLEKAGELAALGFDEMCRGAGVVVIEWADRVSSLTEAYEPITINLTHRGENERSISIKGLSAEVAKAIDGGTK